MRQNWTDAPSKRGHLACCQTSCTHCFPSLPAEVDLKALADAKMLKRMRILEEQVGGWRQGWVGGCSCCVIAVCAVQRIRSLQEQVGGGARCAAPACLSLPCPITHCMCQSSHHITYCPPSPPVLQGARFAGKCIKDLRSLGSDGWFYPQVRGLAKSGWLANGWICSIAGTAMAGSTRRCPGWG